MDIDYESASTAGTQPTTSSNLEEDPVPHNAATSPLSTATTTGNLLISPEGTTDTAANSKKKCWSTAWNHFTKVANNPDVSICNYCKGRYASASGNGTTSLHGHLSRCKYAPFQKDKKQKSLPFKPKQNDSLSEGSQNFDQAEHRKELARMLIVMELPFRTVEHPGLLRYLTFLQPQVLIPSRVTIAKDCYDLYLREKEKLKEFFSKSSQRVCLTTDTWTSCQNLNYMVLTAHYIDEKWKLHKKIINFCQISGHSGEVIGKAIEQRLVGWNISKVFTLTVDNASSNDLGVQYLRRRLKSWNTLILDGKYLHVRCCAHVLNLIVREGLKDLDNAICRIRSAVRYVRSSPARLQRFKDCAEQEKLEFRSLLCLDVETRWNSTYLMLDSAIKYRKAFDLLELRDSKYRDDLVKTRGLPGEEDWDYASAVIPFLKIFYDATKVISGSVYVTSNQFMKEVWGIGLKINHYCKSPDYNLSSMAEKMKMKHSKYYGNIGNINLMLFISVVLDPRHKAQYVEWVIDQSYESSQAKLLKDKVTDTMKTMFEEYKVRNCKGSISSLKKKGTSSEPSKSLDEADFLTQLYMNQSGIQHQVEKSELHKYLEEACDPYINDFDILLWWKVNCLRYPIVAMMARDVLAMPVSTIASESAFSTGGRVLDPFRSSLSPRMVEALICAQDWLRYPLDELDLEAYIEGLETFEDLTTPEATLTSLDD